MKQKGKMVPANTGPVPSMKRVRAGMWMSGRTSRMPAARARTTPTLMKADR